MDEVVRKIAGFGLPGIVLTIVMATTGLTGAAAMTAALAFLGGPAGMFGGILVLGATAMIGDALAKVGLGSFLEAIYLYRCQDESCEALIREIRKLPIIDRALRDNLIDAIERNCDCD